MLEHEVLDAQRFASIPNRGDMVKIVGDTVDVKINGKLIGIKNHLDEQDVLIRQLGNKIQPFDEGKTWIKTAGKVVLYFGALAYAFVTLEQLFNIHL